MSSVTNWVSGEANIAKVQVATDVLANVKRMRYAGGRKKYKLVKIGDHPPTYKEVLVEDTTPRVH
jgi:hypothetical protein